MSNTFFTYFWAILTYPFDMLQKAYLILIFSVLLYSNLFAQLVWPDYPDGRLYRINLQEKLLEQELPNNTWTSIGVIISENIPLSEFPSNTRTIAIEIPHKPTERYLLVDCTNQIYHFDFRTKVLRRLDNTFYRGYNCFSTRFIRKDTVYSFGGYGFWHTNNIQTYFKKNSLEWESLHPTSTPPIAINQGLNAYLEKGDVFFSAYNRFHSDAVEAAKSSFDDDVYLFSFKTQEWEKKGEIKYEGIKKIFTDFAKTPILWTGKYFLIQYKDGAVIKMLVIDPFANTVAIWKDEQMLFESQMNGISEEKPFDIYCWHDTLYFSQSTSKKHGLRQKLAISQIVKQAKIDGVLYGTDTSPYWYAMFGVLILVTVLGLVYKSRLKADSNIKLKVNFSEQELKLIQLLLEEESRTGIDSNKMNEVLGIEDKLPENQRKLRTEFIKELNRKLEKEYKVKDALIRKSSESDKRYSLYLLSDEVFYQLKGKIA